MAQWLKNKFVTWCDTAVLGVKDGESRVQGQELRDGSVVKTTSCTAMRT